MKALLWERIVSELDDCAATVSSVVLEGIQNEPEALKLIPTRLRMLADTISEATP